MADAFHGLSALLEDLRRMPTALESAASELVHTAADTMHAEVVNEYPEVTGNLESHVTVVRVNAYRAEVRSTAKHALLYERGSVERMHASGKSVGAMPKANVFIPAAIKARRHMERQIIKAVESYTVRGMSGRLAVKDDGRD